MKKPKGYSGFAFDEPRNHYNEEYLKTKAGKKDIKKQKKRNKINQKHLKTHGWDYTETWNLDNTITMFVLPRLKAFSETLHGYPYSLTEKKWEKILKKMILAFELMAEGDNFGEEDYKKRQIDINKGLKLFAKYYQGLWD
jgi:hypothetical protein